MMRTLISAITLCVVMLLINACYVPDKFKAEVRMSRYGDYVLSFEGELIYLPIIHDYVQGLVKPSEEAEKLANIKEDLSRDPAFSTIRSLGRGRFYVKYLGPIRHGKAGGRLGINELVSIFRRDEHLIRIKSNPDNQVVLLAESLRPTDAEAMQAQNLSMTGEFRLTTDANVIQHNATEVRTMGAYKVYIWKIENALSPMPHAVMIRDIDPERSLRDKPH